MPEIYNAATSGNLKTAPMSINNHHRFAYSFKWDGTLNGLVALEASNDETDSSSWVEIPGSSQSTQAQPGNHIINMDGAGFQFVRASYTHVGGSGNLIINHFYK